MNTETAIEYMRRAAEQSEMPLDIDDENRSAVTAAATWLAREKSEGMDLNKGLLIVGHVGTGKTMLLKTVRTAMRDAYGVQFGIKSCQDLVRQFTEDGYEPIEMWMNAPHVCFDDLGAEGEAVHYGKRTNLMSEVIEARYERLMSGVKCWSHFTTNLGADKIRSHYGDRVASRLQHMTNMIVLGGTSASRDRRRTAAAPAFTPSVNADNVYTTIHPRIAARLGEVLGALKREKVIHISTGPSEHSFESHLVQLAAVVAEMELAELNDFRSNVVRENDEAIAAPYLKVVDVELAKRASKEGGEDVASNIDRAVRA
jgi:DNA replication protein DnaC